MIDIEMSLALMTASGNTTDPKIQARTQRILIRGHLQLADLWDLASYFSPAIDNVERSREHRQKAIVILKPLVAAYPNAEWPKNMLARARCTLDEEGLTPRQVTERAVEMLQRLIADNPNVSLYQRLLVRAQRELDNDDLETIEAERR